MSQRKLLRKLRHRFVSSALIVAILLVAIRSIALAQEPLTSETETEEEPESCTEKTTCIPEVFLSSIDIQEQSSAEACMNTSRIVNYDERTIAYTYKDLIFCVASVINSEAGYSYCDDYWQQLVGYAFMNRYGSKYYGTRSSEEHSYLSVLYDKPTTYDSRTRQNYEQGIVSDRALANATIVVENYFNDTLPVPKSMVFQSEKPQGIPFYQTGNTYFGLDARIEEDLKKEAEQAVVE